MPKIKDLSSKFKLPVAEKELELLFGQQIMGNRQGGLSLYSTKFKRGYGNAVFGSDENGIWLGAAEYAAAPFRVDMNGNLVATKTTITGMGLNFVSTIVWTATDIDTATWVAGTIKTSDGTSYSIAGGDTGNIVAKTYIYLDPATSTTVLQTSTTATDAAGDGKILVAIVQIGGTGAKCIIDVVGSTGTTIDGDKIITGKIQSKDGNTFFDLDNDRIQIQDEDSTTIIDATGLVGTATFEANSVHTPTDFTTTSTTFVDITSMSVVTSSYSRAIPTIFLYTSLVQVDTSSSFSAELEIALNLDGSIPNDLTKLHNQGFKDTSGTPDETSGTLWKTLTTHYYSTPGVGTHTYKMQAKTDVFSGSTPTVTIWDQRMTVLVLGT